MYNPIKAGLLTAITVCLFLSASAQEKTKIDEGIVSYNLVPNNGSEQEKIIKFNREVSRFDFEAGPAMISILNNSKDTTGLVLIDISVANRQMAAKLNAADIADQNKGLGKGQASGFKATGEKQKIAGYDAEKYTYVDDISGTFEVWITDQLELPLNMATSSFKCIAGTVVKFTSKEGTTTLKTVNAVEVGELNTNKVPASYTLISYADLKSMQSGGR